MEIMCLNGWGGACAEALLAYVAEADPDVLCLQEVIRCDASKPVLTYRDDERVLSQRANFFGEVAAVLPGHDAYFAPSQTGPLWDGEEAYVSYWGIATYVRRSFPVIGMVQGFVHGDYLPDGYGENPRPRTAHGIRVHDPVAGRVVSLTQMHGLREPRGKMDTPERGAQAKRFLGLSQELSQPGDLQVLCGDFNVEPESETIRLLTEAGFTELVAAHGFATTRSALYPKPGKWADYMLIDDPGAVRRFEVVYDPVVSDHCPLLLEI